MALLGLALIGLVLETLLIAYLLYEIYRNRQPTLLPPEPTMLKRFGVLWDKNQNPHCPVDKTLMAFFSHGLISDHPCDYLICPACKATIALWDSLLTGLSVFAAKEFIRKDIRRGQISD
jgi:hypothetical protein